MNKVLLSLWVGVLALSFSVDAEAQRRMGGGRNVGRQAPQVQKSTAPQAQPAAQNPQAASASSAAQPATQSAAQPAASKAAPAAVANPAAAATTTAARSPMKSMLMGAAAGLGLMALASWLGFGEGLATVMLMVLLGVVVLMAVQFFMRRRLALQGASHSARVEPLPLQRTATTNTSAPTSAPTSTPISAAGVRPGSAMDHFLRAGAVNPATPWGVPAGFDVEGFLAQARVYFGKLQAAWQSGDLEALSDFTTHEMFTALTHELHARTQAPKHIEVGTLQARLLGIESDAAEHVASVRFTGALRIDGEEEAVDEVWNLAKPADGRTGWLLAGIQQIPAQISAP